MKNVPKDQAEERQGCEVQITFEAKQMAPKLPQSKYLRIKRQPGEGIRPK